MNDRYNLGTDLTDRHVIAGDGDRLALVFEDSAGFSARYSYRDLAVLSNRFAQVLRGLGVVPGDRVFFRVPNHPAFYYGALGCAKLGAVFIPSSTLFRSEEVAYRLRDSGAVVVVTTESLLPEVERAAGELDDLREVLIVDDAGERPARAGRSGLSTRMGRARDQFVPTNTSAEDPAFIAYSSGTTGDSKGILHMQRYARSYDYLIRDWHGYTAETICACPPEIGWMLPVASSFLFSLRAGAATVLYRERAPRFRPQAWCRLIQQHRISSFVGTPTIYRMLLTLDELDTWDLSSLRGGTSAGEPLPPDTCSAVTERLGITPLDGIGMSECMVYAHNRIDQPVQPGACGFAGGDVELAVLDEHLQSVEAGRPGVLCLKRESHPGLMREYWRKPEQTRAVFRGEWYWTGDLVQCNQQGLYSFVGRADDVMNCAGYRISPFEVESALATHPAVLEAAAVQSPDDLRGQVVKGFVTLRTGHVGGEQLEREIIAHVKARIAPFKAPRRLEFVAELPKTQSGKVKRAMLRERERQ